MKMKSLFWAMSAGCFLFAGHAYAQSGTPVLGGALYYAGGDIEVKVQPASAGYTSELGLYKGTARKQLIATNRETNKVVTITAAQLSQYGFAKGDELVFGIFVTNTSTTYYMGAGTRNPDAIAHANLTADAKGATVGFEDLFGGGDRDYDDNVFFFSGGIAPTPPPPPPPPNSAPDCSKAKPSVTELWPPNHEMVPVTIQGCVDKEKDAITLKIVSIMQDEPVSGTGTGSGNFGPDGVIDGQGVKLRAERSGKGDTRVYNITFTATDAKGATGPQTTISVAVPKSQKAETPPKGPVTFDSTKAVPKPTGKAK